MAGARDRPSECPPRPEHPQHRNRCCESPRSATKPTPHRSAMRPTSDPASLIEVRKPTTAGLGLRLHGLRARHHSGRTRWSRHALPIGGSILADFADPRHYALGRMNALPVWLPLHHAECRCARLSSASGRSTVDGRNPDRALFGLAWSHAPHGLYASWWSTLDFHHGCPRSRSCRRSRASAPSGVPSSRRPTDSRPGSALNSRTARCNSDTATALVIYDCLALHAASAAILAYRLPTCFQHVLPQYPVSQRVVAEVLVSLRFPVVRRLPVVTASFQHAAVSIPRAAANRACRIVARLTPGATAG